MGQQTIARQRIRVLLIDDSEADYFYTQSLLDDVNEADYECSWACDYQTGLEALLEGRHDVCLVDQNLGVATGVDLLAAGQQAGVTIPIIMLTGTGEGAVDREAMGRGAADFLTKDMLSSCLLERTIRYAIERRRLQVDMESAAKQDSLTGLANRRHLYAFLGDAIARARRSNHVLGVLFIDLDHFKEINDRFGHSAGDRLLKEVACLLTTSVRQGDLVARLGGDEFAIILDNIGSPDNAAGIAQKILDAIASSPPVPPTNPHRVGASIGVAVWPQDGGDADKIILAADAAMYCAKSRGRNNFQCFEGAMHAKAQRRSEIQGDLSTAIAKNELSIAYQAQFASQTGQVKGFEALLRWTRGGRPVDPAEFISVAEECGLIGDLGEWVLRTACSQFRDWEMKGLLPRGLTLAVNVSAHQLTDGGLLATVSRILNQTGLDPTRLELEITESAAILNIDRAKDELVSLTQRGVRIALDDFGTGHSSLSYLLRLPIQTIKIDRSFVQSCIENESGAVLVKGTLGLARALGMNVVAEGVESEHQRNFLSDNGCPILQGFLLHRPCNSAAAEAILRSDERGEAAATGQSQPDARAPRTVRAAA